MITHDTSKKSIEEMDRTEIVFELARHAHPTWYHELLVLPTRWLAGLLAFYRHEK